MQPFSALARVSRAIQIRHGSSGSVPTYSARWANTYRAESNVHTPEDPPRDTLPENHEAGEGTSDFSNWVDKHEDTSTAQVLGGMTFIAVSVYGIHLLSQYDRKNKTPTFTKRELPSVDNDIPTMATKHFSQE